MMKSDAPNPAPTVNVPAKAASSVREASLSIIKENTPQCLRVRPQWVVWRYEKRKDKITKVPYDVRTGRRASSTDPATWTPFEEAVSRYARDDRYNGVGYVFSADDPFCGVDLDDCLDEKGQMSDWAEKIVTTFGSYTEISPSGQGLKLFIRASKPGADCRKPYHDGEVEIYDHERFFVVTGRRIETVSADVESRQAELEDLYHQIFVEPRTTPAPAVAPSTAAPIPVQSPQSLPLSDDDIIRLACRARKSGQKFTALWEGRWEDRCKSHSEADASLVFRIAFYTKDATQIDRLFRRSKLYRPKWDEKRGAKTYGQGIIDKALSKVTAQYRPGRRRQNAAATGTAQSGQTPETDDQANIALGQREPTSGRLVLSAKRTLPTAEAYVREFHSHADGRTLHNYVGLLMNWRDNHYTKVEDEAVKNQLQPWLHDAFQPVLNRQANAVELVPFHSNPITVKAALESIRTLVHLSELMTPPVWLGPAYGKPDAREVLPCRTVNLHIPTGLVFPATPSLFATNALEFDYNADAPAPEHWLVFLDQLWDGDEEALQLLQEWFGYCLTGNTSQQKMLMIIGPKRSGKGTVGRVLQRLVGVANVVGPTTRSLTGTFGLQPLIGKSLAIVSDARFSGEDIMIAVERLLCISGEDTLTIDRKHTGAVTMKLPTRFVFLTNELPRFADASSALAGRFLILRLTQSFYGREDPLLTGRLLAELPGILLWALQGWARLRERGRFIQPRSVEDAVRALEELSSPVGAFVRDQCVVAPGLRIEAAALYAAWKNYCIEMGREHAGTVQTFGRDLGTAVPGLRVTQPRTGDVNRPRWYEGIALASHAQKGS